ncbi:MAG: outer membrane protein assembly factor BamB family protein [Gammaproteobacteria bacterium]
MHRLTAALVLLAASLATAADDARLAQAAADNANWLSYGHGHGNQRFSALDAIDRETVAGLRPAWIYQTGVLGTFPANPLVVDGVMYLTTPFNHVVALDAATGAERWRYTHERSTGKLCCGSHNRGLGWGYGRLYMMTADGRFVALDAATGQKVWDIPVVDPMTRDPADLDAIRVYDEASRARFERYTRFAGNMAPVVYDGKVFVGVSGTGYTATLDEAESDSAAVLGRPGTRRGLSAFLTAYDAHDGRLLWRWYVTPDTGWEGGFVRETAFGDVLERDVEAERQAVDRYPAAWLGGGGSLYSTPAIDPELGLVFLGTGNPSPGYADFRRPGDNLYTASLVALDVDTGTLRWHHQIIPHDIWGYDVSAPPMLIEAAGADGRPVKAVAAASKSGWLHVFERATGRPLRRSEAFVPQSDTMFRRPTGDGLMIAPGAGGGANWPPMAWGRDSGLVFVTATHNPTRYRRELDDDGNPLTIMSLLVNPERWGVVSAIDPDDGRIRWQHRTELPLVSGALATAGGLLFHGQSNGDFVARDQDTGEVLWRFATGAGVNAPPVTYELDGRQYVVVAAGGHRLFRFPLGDAVIAFALPD